MEQELRFLRSRVSKLESTIQLLSNAVEDKISLVLIRFLNQKVAEVIKAKHSLQLEEDLYKSLLSSCTTPTTTTITTTAIVSNSPEQTISSEHGSLKRSHNSRRLKLKRKSTNTATVRKPDKPTTISTSLSSLQSSESLQHQQKHSMMATEERDLLEDDPSTDRGQRSVPRNRNKKKKTLAPHDETLGVDDDDDDDFTKSSNNDLDDELDLSCESEHENVELMQFKTEVEAEIETETPSGLVNVWSQFTKSADKTTATCKLCSKRLKTTNSGTTALHTHLQKVHHLNTEKCNNRNKKDSSGLKFQAEDDEGW